jgi:cyclopropane fatty-acyl-phospholipid synthase-like methyltransferase
MTASLHPRPPVDPTLLNGDGGTMWTNLGYWGPRDSARQLPAAGYVAAARALASRVGGAAGLDAHDVVLDYACGFGDSLRLWIDAFSVKTVVGVEPDPLLCREITARLEAWGLSNRIQIICARAEDVSVASVSPDVSAVVCVDAAYHFRTRRAWLGNLGASAPSGLKLGIADLAVPAGSERSLRLRGLARLMRIPRANLMSARSIALACEDSGFTVHSCEHVGEQVLDGFVVNSRSVSMPIAVTRAAVRYARQHQLLDYCIIGARR